ncbi:MAG: DNA helicase RecQ [Gammaproteobacteria bacterium]|nr:DNA helicase RecQ [Gammaproteobacteria bacterium]
MNQIEQARGVLRSVFGYEQFRSQQQEIIEHVIDGGDALVLAPTGSGKSICYQIPSIVRRGTGVVVSPLIALMQDQVNGLRQSGVRASYLNSTMARQEAAEVERQLLAGELDLLYVAPERLMNSYLLDLLERAEVALFAIDEAHCVSQWGHDFRPEYHRLEILHQRFPQIPRIAVTATADEPTRQEIIEKLDLGQAGIFTSGFDRPNIFYRINQFQNGRDQLLRFLNNEHRGDAGIVYCLSRKKVDATAQWLSSNGRRALPYHAGLSSDLRQKHQDCFIKEEGVIVVATIAFGMGIDKPNVRFVAHLDLPKSLEAYYQETGRAGRDGLPANAWMSYGLQNVITLRQMVEGSNADDNRKRVERHKLDAMLGLCEVTTCRRQALLSYFGEQRAEPCGHCDNCLEPVDTWDATEAVRKLLSCCYRTGQRFGGTYLIDVLLGKEGTRIMHNGHHQISTYAIGKELSVAQWRSVLRQLVARGIMSVDVAGHGSLMLTESSRPILRGEQQIFAKREIEQPKSRQKSRHTSHVSEADRLFWEQLRQLRRELAEEQNVPPYVIFHDATLMEMMRCQPRSLGELGQLSGVGERKLEKYGSQFLELLLEQGDAERSESAVTISSTVEESLNLFRLGMDVQKIAAQRGITPEVVYGHMAKAIESGLVAMGDVVDLSDDECLFIEDTLSALPYEKRHELKGVYQALDGQYSYGVLRCVRANQQVNA